MVTIGTFFSASLPKMGPSPSMNINTSGEGTLFNFFLGGAESDRKGIFKILAVKPQDAPVLLKFSIGEFKRLLRGFREVRIVPERFPVKSRLHGGWKGAIYNGVFVGAFNVLPRRVVRPFGWHLLAFCRK